MRGWPGFGLLKRVGALPAAILLPIAVLAQTAADTGSDPAVPQPEPLLLPPEGSGGSADFAADGRAIRRQTFGMSD